MYLVDSTYHRWSCGHCPAGLLDCLICERVCHNHPGVETGRAPSCSSDPASQHAVPPLPLLRARAVDHHHARAQYCHQADLAHWCAEFLEEEDIGDSRPIKRTVCTWVIWRVLVFNICIVSSGLCSARTLSSGICYNLTRSPATINQSEVSIVLLSANQRPVFTCRVEAAPRSSGSLCSGPGHQWWWTWTEHCSEWPLLTRDPDHEQHWSTWSCDHDICHPSISRVQLQCHQPSDRQLEQLSQAESADDDGGQLRLEEEWDQCWSLS